MNENGNDEGVSELILAFETDYSKFTFITLDEDLIDQAQTLLNRYGEKGLRTLDSIQLASMVLVQSELSVALASDQLLNTFIEAEGIRVWKDIFT